MFDKNTNFYHLFYISVMTTIVAVGLAVAVSSLKEKQDRNVAISNKTDILKAVGLDDAEDIEATYASSIKGIILDHEGNEVDGGGVLPLDVDVKKESKKDKASRQFPLFIYESEEGPVYIIPMRGAGLWDAIWGYVAIKSDFSTIVGVSFDHVSETPGLGAEIKDNIEWGEQFVGKQIKDASGEFISVAVVKGRIEMADHQVSSISGATVTSDGVSDMMYEDIEDYLPYFNKIKTN